MPFTVTDKENPQVDGQEETEMETTEVKLIADENELNAERTKALLIHRPDLLKLTSSKYLLLLKIKVQSKILTSSPYFKLVNEKNTAPSKEKNL